MLYSWHEFISFLYLQVLQIYIYEYIHDSDTANCVRHKICYIYDFFFRWLFSKTILSALNFCKFTQKSKINDWKVIKLDGTGVLNLFFFSFASFFIRISLTLDCALILLWVIEIRSSIGDFLGCWRYTNLAQRPSLALKSFPNIVQKPGSQADYYWPPLTMLTGLNFAWAVSVAHSI